MQVFICTVVRHENNYIKEWLDYYKQLSVDKIIVYDNNDLEDNSLEILLKDYVKSGFVILKNIRNQHNRNWIAQVQLKCYRDCYDNYKCDWMIFCDVDEFLNFKNFVSIKEFLSQPVFNDYDYIKIPWQIYDDNDLMEVKDGNYSIKRFTRKADVHKKFRNAYKSIIKCNLDLDFNSPHCPEKCNKYSWSYKRISKKNFKLKCFDYMNPNIHNLKKLSQESFIVFNHYMYKTLQEFLDVKYENYNKMFFRKNMLCEFFRYNKKTPEKIAYVNKRLGNINFK